VTDVPRRLRPDASKRARTILTQTRGAHSAQGSTSAARPVVATRTARTYATPPPDVRLGTAGANSTSIESTGSVAGTGTTAGDQAVAIGHLSTVGDNSVGIGYDLNVLGEYLVRLGFAGLVSGSYSMGFGYAVTVTADNAGGFGQLAEATANGAWAFGADSSGTGAVAANENDMVFGTANHNVQVPGRFNVAPRTPSGSADTQGMTGDIAADDSYVYVKTSTGWKRAALATF